MFSKKLNKPGRATKKSTKFACTDSENYVWEFIKAVGEADCRAGPKSHITRTVHFS